MLFNESWFPEEIEQTVHEIFVEWGNARRAYVESVGEDIAANEYIDDYDLACAKTFIELYDRLRESKKVR
jgi:hypothetical protein